MPPRYSTRNAARMRTMVKVSTYNVLSSHLAAPNWFQACKPEFLDSNYRLESVKRKLEKECAEDAIICLQEVSHTWAGSLHSFFAARDYHLITALYGNRMNNYMGVAVAVPKQKYNILDVSIQKVADTKYMPRKPKLTTLQEFLKGLQSFLVKLAIWLNLYRPPFDLWDNVLYRHNQMICTRLQDKHSEKSFVLGTYHMPCMFDQIAVMVTHTALSAQYIQKYTERLCNRDSEKVGVPASSGQPETMKIDPIIYCGDYNFKPSSTEYELITKGKLDKEHPHQPPAIEGDNWTTDLVTPFASAYATKFGAEPDFTNFAKVQQQPEFIDTLDYIFYTPNDSIEVEDVLALPHRSTVNGPLPNEEEPSDHILLSATFKL